MRKIAGLTLGLLVVLQSCGDIIGTRMIPGDENINYYISQTTKLAMPEETAKPVFLKTYNPDDADMPAEYSGKGIAVKRYKMGLGFNETLLLNPQSAVVWPGALLDAPSVISGTYKPIIAERAPLTYSISGNFLSGKLSRTVESPTLSTMRNSINDLLSQSVAGNCAASMSFDIQKVDSEETATIQMGAQIGDAQNYAKANYDFTDTSVKSRFLIKFLQVYYTLDIDVPSRPSDFFSNYAKYEQFGYMISDNVSPVYIASVKYGRIVLFSVESANEASEVKTALSAVLTALKTNGAIGDSDKAIVDSCSIKGMILGGSSEDAATASLSGVTGLQAYITKGANFSLASPGAPLAYTLRYLKNNEVARMVLYNEFCLPESAVPGEPEVPIYPAYMKFYVYTPQGNLSLPSKVYLDNSDTTSTDVILTNKYLTKNFYYDEGNGISREVENNGNYITIETSFLSSVNLILTGYGAYGQFTLIFSKTIPITEYLYNLKLGEIITIPNISATCRSLSSIDSRLHFFGSEYASLYYSINIKRIY